MHPNLPMFASDNSQPNYSDPYGGAPAHALPMPAFGSSQPSLTQSMLGAETSQPATWQSAPRQPAIWQPGPYPQAQSTWQHEHGPNPPTIGGGSYPQAQSTCQQVPHPQAQSTWQQGPYPQAQSILGGGSNSQSQSTLQSGPYPQSQSILGGGSYPQAQSTWQQGPHPQAQSTWQQGPYPQAQSILGGENYPQPQPSAPSEAQSTWHPQPQPSAPSEGGGQPILADQQQIPLARIKKDEQIIPDIAKVIIRKVERFVDPDSDSSSECCACRQRIFSTPSINFSRGNEKLFLHEQCTTLPLNYLHELHLHQPLLLINHLLHPPLAPTDFSCHNCNQTCGTSFYQCPDPNCDYRLDLLCVLQIKIKHRSHHHAMTLIRLKDPSSLTCGACNTKHDSESEPESEKLSLSYLCSLCGYWIHPDCASLLNALHYKHHPHSLFLIYNLLTSTPSKCFVCSKLHKGTSGVFVCLKCTNYLVHINCAVQDPHNFKPGMYITKLKKAYSIFGHYSI